MKSLKWGSGPMKFTKMQGLGNDYIYIDCFAATVDNPAALAPKISNRHFGVGGDGLVLILPSAIAAARMQMFNADGSEAEMCGNAIRCVAKYLYDHRLVSQANFEIETLSGIKKITIHTEHSTVRTVRVDMGIPILDSQLVPVNTNLPETVHFPLAVNGRSYNFTAVSMGNPHCVIFVPEISDAMVWEDGPAIEINPLFPRKTNVEFVQVVSRDLIVMRVWERGSGETLACGTGSCASAVAAMLNSLTDRKVTARLLGGDLEVEWDPADNHVYMTGPAVEVFQGEWPDFHPV
jgi:diaminopimelate epimerase